MKAMIEGSAARIHELCGYIETHLDADLSLEALGRRAHLSTFHLQRRFKALVGITPRQFVEAARLRRFKHGLRGGARVTDAIYGAGFGSSSRVYERLDTRLGMTPKEYRAGGAGLQISYAGHPSALGPMLLGATDRGLCFLQFGDDERGLLAQLKREYPRAELTPMAPQRRAAFESWMRALAAYLDGSRPKLSLPLDVRGTAFQVKVWRYLQCIPYGEVRSYAEVARAIGQPTAVRAVASACAGNRLLLAIPCHRVIRGDGSLGGYRAGPARKRTLIDAERAAAARRV